MSTTIDQRVVQMKFDNKSFEKNAGQTIQTLEQLEKKSSFKGASAGLMELEQASKRVTLSQMGQAVEAVEVKFSALQMVALSVFQRITNGAIDAGKNLLKSLTISPISQGFEEYELKMGSVQTIMAGTGESIETVNKYLDELNHYADKTIYSFSDMTSNIGKFTNAGVKLEDAVKAIQGISNEAAVSGANAQQASHAMYNFAQALSAGYVKLIDWKSIETANMATMEFKEQLIQTAVEVGTLTEGMDGYYYTLEGHGFNATRDFNEYLKDQWMSTEVLVQTLGKYADETTEIGRKAFAAAQDVKTFTQLIDTLKEAVGSGWAESWQILFGDFEEAKKLWTSVSQVVGGFIDEQSKSRNELLSGWKNLGGRDVLIESISIAFNNLSRALSAVKQGFREVFPKQTSETLYQLTLNLREFVKQLELSDDALYTAKVAVKALLIPLKLLFAAIKIGVIGAELLALTVFKLADAFLSMLAQVKPSKEIFDKLFTNQRYIRFTTALSTIIDKLSGGFSRLVVSGAKFTKTGIVSFFKNLYSALQPIADVGIEAVISGFETLSQMDFIDWAKVGSDALQIVSNHIKAIGDGILTLLNFFGQFLKLPSEQKIQALRDAFKDLLDPIFGEQGILGGFNEIQGSSHGAVSTLNQLGESIKNLLGHITPAKALIFAFGTGLTAMVFSISNAFDSVKTTMNTFTGLLRNFLKLTKPSKITDISKALTLLAASLTILSLVDVDKLRQATISMGVMMVGLTAMVGILAGIDKIVSGTKGGNFSGILNQLPVIAGSVAAMAVSLAILSSIDLEGIWQKVGVLGLIMAELLAATAIMAHFDDKDVTKNIFFMLGYVLAIGALVKALKTLASADFTGITNNLGALTILMGILLAISVVASKIQNANFGGVLLLSLSLLAIAKILDMIRKYDPVDILESLGNFSMIFMALAALAELMRSVGGQTTNAGVQILAMAASLIVIVQAIKGLSSINSSDLGKGLLAVTAILGMFGILSKALATDMEHTAKVGKTIIAMSAAILLLGVAIKYLGELDLWSLIKGTVAVSALLLVFGQIIKIGGEAKSATAPIAAMTVAIGLITAAIVLFTLIPAAELYSAARALALGLIALGACMKLIGDMNLTKPLRTIGVLTVLLGGVTLAIAALSAMHPDQAIKNATALSEVLIALGVSAKLMSSFKVPKDIVGTFTMLGGALFGVSIILGLMQQMQIEGAADKGTGLALGLISLGIVTVILTKVGTNVGAAISAAGALAVMAVVVGAMVGALGILLNDPDARKVADIGLEYFPKLGLAIGEFMGNVVGGFLEGALTGGLPGMATNLSEFITNLQPFLDGASKIKPNMGEGIHSLADALAAFSQANIWESVAMLFQGDNGESSIAKFSELLPDLGDALQTFSDSIKNVNVSKIKQAAEAAKTLADMANSLQGGFFQNVSEKIFGENDLVSFGEQLAAFGPKFALFGYSIANVDMKIVDKATACAKSLAALEKDLPRKGGALEEFFGTKDLGTFGSRLNLFGWWLVQYASKMVDFPTKAVKSSADAAKVLVDLENGLPREGSVVSNFLFGEKNIAIFGEQLYQFGLSFNKYSHAINTLDENVVDNTGIIVDVVNQLSDAIPKTTGLIAALFNGRTDFADFGEKMKKFALSMQQYALTMQGTDFKAIGETISTQIGDGIIEYIYIPQERIRELFSSLIKNAEEELGISRQESQEFYDIGYYIIAGLVTGLDKNEKLALNAATRIARDLVTRMEKELLIQSPSKVTRDRIGRFIVQGIAEGITMDMSAEDAAAKKAQNIVNAFKTTLDSINLDMTTLDLENQLWSSLDGLNATAAQQAQKSQELLIAKLEKQSERVAYADAEYQTTLKTLGENSDSTQEAYNKWLQEKINLNSMAQELAEASREVAANQQNYINNYYELLRLNTETMLQQGFSMDQIQQWATGKSGFDPNKQVQEVVNQSFAAGFDTTNVQSIVEHFMQNVSVTIDNTMPQSIGRSVKTATQKAAPQLQETGQGIGQELLNGMGEEVVNNGGGVIEKALSEVSQAWFDKDYSGTLSGIGNNIVDGLGSGISGAADKVVQKGKDLISWLKGGAEEAADIHSPSRVFAEIGAYLVAGLVEGIETSQTRCIEAIQNLISNIILAIQNLNSADERSGGNNNQLYEAGYRLIQSFVQGLEDGALQGAARVRELLAEIATTISEINANYHDSGYQIGMEFNNGMMLAIRDGRASIINEIVQTAVQAYQAALQALNSQGGGLGMLTSIGGLSAGGTVANTPSGVGGGGSSGVTIGQSPVNVGASKNAKNSSEQEEEFKENTLKNLGKMATSIIQIGTTVSRVLTVNKEIADSETAKTSNKTEKDSTTVNNYNFTQNNTSPKALSATDIYRQTKNQFSTLKEVTKKK